MFGFPGQPYDREDDPEYEDPPGDPIDYAKEEGLLEPESEAERIERWRAEELERAGYGPCSAAKIAVRKDIDLHVAADLLARGCTQPLALEILL